MAQAAPIAAPRAAATRTAVCASTTPATAAAASSPTEWPAVRAPAGMSNGGRRQQSGGHDQWLGDRGVLDLVRIRRRAEPNQVETARRTERFRQVR